MKLLILSDLHLELGASLTLSSALDYDVVVLAGDIHSPGRKVIDWARSQETFGGKPVVVVPGNHEFYGCVMDSELKQMRFAATDSNVHVLSRDVQIIAGVRFVGCTLWTDFQLEVRQADGSMQTNIARSIVEASMSLNDFRCIEILVPMRSQHRERRRPMLLRAEDTLAMHWIERDWLRRVLKEPFDGETVVVTHHAPSKLSVAQKYAGDSLTPAFVSDLPNEFFDVPSLWVHGHTHTSADYWRGDCRVVSNPRGYNLSDGQADNQLFDPGLIIDIAAE